MARDGIELIIYRCGPCRGHFQSIGFHQYDFSYKPALSELHFFASGLSKVDFKASG